MERIAQLLQARPKHSLADLREIQADQLSLAGSEAAAVSSARRSSTHPLAAAAQAAARGLRRHDGGRQGRAADLLGLGAPARREGVFADEVGPAGLALGAGSFRDAHRGRARAQRRLVVRRQARPPPSRPATQQIDAAFTRALDELQAAQGADVAALALGPRSTSRARSIGRSAASRRWRGGSSCARRSAATPTPSTSRA